jgi:hypothetical protein
MSVSSSMARVRALALVATVVAVNVAACAKLPPKTAVGGPQPSVVLTAPAFINAPRPQLGIDIDFYAWRGMDEVSVARADIGYVKRLHANSVSINFPFFMSGPQSSTVHAGRATPSPSQLAELAAVARAAGLYVSIRPLLDETTFGESRVEWKPRDPATWFTSYKHFLLPYVRMAQSTRIPEFFSGVEFAGFSGSPRWIRLNTALSRVYRGTLAYASNWWKYQLRSTTIDGVRQTLDVYAPLPLRPNATTAEVAAAWISYAHTFAAHIVMSEVGIAAQRGAYKAPYKWSWPGEPLLPAIQVRWFTGACRATSAAHLGGVYFWSVNFGQSLTKPPTTANPGAFVGGPGARAIADCFRRS